VSVNKIDNNLQGKNGTETITNFATIGDSSTAVVGATVVSSGKVEAGSYAEATTYVKAGSYVEAGSYMKAGSYLKLGDHKYLFISDYDTAASALAELQAVDASCKGSLILGPGNIYKVHSDAAASALIAN